MCMLESLMSLAYSIQYSVLTTIYGAIHYIYRTRYDTPRVFDFYINTRYVVLLCE